VKRHRLSIGLLCLSLVSVPPRLAAAQDDPRPDTGASVAATTNPAAEPIPEGGRPPRYRRGDERSQFDRGYDRSPFERGDAMGPPPGEFPRRYWGDGGRLGDGRRGDGMRGGDLQPDEISEEKWAEVERFMKEHSPRRIRRFEDVPEERKERLRQFMTRRFDGIQQSRVQDPTLYELRVKRIEIEDEIFDLGLELKDAERGESQATRAKLRAKLKELVENGLAERKHWLARAEQRVNTERDGIKRQEENLESFVDNQLRGMIEQDRWPALGSDPAMASPRPPQDRPGPGQGGGPRFRGGEGRFAAPTTRPGTD
jgi:hypothetical protein